MDTLSRIVLLQKALGKKFPEVDKSIAITGLGAVGSWVLRILIACGYRNYLLLDNDVLAESDFNRNALFDWGKVGKYKTDIAGEVVRNFLSPVGEPNIVLINSGIGKTQDWKILRKADFVFDCIDGLNGKANLIRFLKEEKIPFISSGATARKISVDPIFSSLSEAKEDPLLRRVDRRLRRWGINTMEVPVVYLKGISFQAFGDREETGLGRKRSVMGSWILSPMVVAVKMVEIFLLNKNLEELQG